MSKRFGRFAALLMASALVVGACAGDSAEEAAENPKEAFTGALDALSEYEGVTVELTIEADPADLASEETPEDVAEKIVNSSLTISAKGGEGGDSQAQILLNVDGNEDAAELRAVDGSLYARVDARGLAEEFGGNVQELEQAAQAATAQGFDFAQAVLDGEWVGLEGVDELARQFGAGADPADAEQARQFADRVIAVLEENSRVTSEGSDDVGAHLVVAVPIKETAEELLDAVQSIAPVPPEALPADALQEIPEGDIPIDVWVDDGRLVQVEIDAVAIARELGEEPPEDVDALAFRMTIDEFTEDVEAPADFAPIDLQEILGGVFGAMPGAGDLGGGGAVPGGDVSIEDLGFSCDQFRGLRPADIEAAIEASGQPGALEAFRQACPELFR